MFHEYVYTKVVNQTESCTLLCLQLISHDATTAMLHRIVKMAAVCNSVYYDCLKELQNDITTQIITQKGINVDRLMKKAKKKALLSSGYHVEPDSGELVASREKTLAIIVFDCIESVKQNKSLFHHFLALLEEVHLEDIVHTIRRKLEHSVDHKPDAPTHGKVSPLPNDLPASTSEVSTDSGISTSVPERRNGPFLPPLVGKTTASQHHLSHINKAPRQSKVPKAGLLSLRSKSFSDDRVGAERMRKILKLTQDKEALQKQLQAKQKEINKLKEELQIEKEMGKYHTCRGVCKLFEGEAK